MSSFSSRLIGIREAVVAGLKAASITFVGENVYGSRTVNAFPEEGDFICIYTNSNSFDDGDRSPVIYRVTSDFVIDIVVQGLCSIDDRVYAIDERMDIITDAVLNVLAHNSVSGNIYSGLGMKKVRVSSIQNTLAGDGEMDKGTQRITMSFMWYLPLPNGEAEDEFLEAGNTLNVEGADRSKAIKWITNTRKDQ